MDKHRYDYDPLGRDTDPWGPLSRRTYATAAPWLTLALVAYAIGKAGWGLSGPTAIVAGALPALVLGHLFRYVLSHVGGFVDRLVNRPRSPVPVARPRTQARTPHDSGAWSAYLTHLDRHRGAVDPFGVWRRLGERPENRRPGA